MSEDYTHEQTPSLAERFEAAQKKQAADLASVQLKTFDQRVLAILAQHETALERLQAEIVTQAKGLEYLKLLFHKLLNRDGDDVAL